MILGNYGIKLYIRYPFTIRCLACPALVLVELINLLSHYSGTSVLVKPGHVSLWLSLSDMND